MKLHIAFALFSLTLAATAEDFKNWYFSYLSEPCHVKGNVFAPDLKQNGTFAGKTRGEVSADGKSFTESFSYEYEPGGQKAESELVWTMGDDGSYRTEGNDLGGNTFNSELRVTGDDSYSITCLFADGKTINTIGERKANGIIYSTDTGKTKEGVVVFIMKYVRSHEKSGEE